MSDLCSMTPARDQFESRANEIFLARGGRDGQDIADWFAAEGELARFAEQSAVPESLNASSVHASKTKSAVAGNLEAVAAFF